MASTVKTFIDEFPDSDKLIDDPTGNRLYVIGQILGDSILLRSMLQKIENSGTFAKNDKVIFLGNFIGKTGNSQKIINTIFEYQEKRPNHTIILRGEHEEEFIRSKIRFYQSEVGKNLIASYRVKQVEPFMAEKNNQVDTKSLMNARHWLERESQYYYETPNYFISHAGVNPKHDLEDQRLVWCVHEHKKFAKINRKYEKIIVHSQTSIAKVENKTTRIGVAGGIEDVLTCAVLSDMLKEKDQCVSEIYAIKHMRKEEPQPVDV